MTVVQVTYFSDILCIWAYVTQARINAVKEKFGATVRFDYRFCSVFGDSARKIGSTWRDKGEYAGSMHICARSRYSSRMSKSIRKFG
jgi:predicted DsbA family dithiol-disulfide isomerase